MPLLHTFRRSSAARFGVLAAAGLAFTCASHTASNAQESPPAVLKSTGLATDVPPAADFVQKTRPGQTDFIPVGVTPPARGTAVRKGADLTKLQSELEATRKAHDHIAGRKEGQTSQIAEDMKKKKKQPQ